ncbi:hypothetical protein [Fluoribacter gormanii]|uniref:hypothetical protein n=1 Tax=Fluoribacter gormanii TaxID=464 RepID=UPI001040E480|nr:hypothetical protein [Fluoribacter gormanii]
MSFTKIDNPGRGNCAFYGFSIGLIDIIKHEYSRYGESATFSSLKRQVDDFQISLIDIINFDYFKQSKEVLDKMQHHLRTVLFEYRKQDIKDNKEHLPASNAYTNFAEMVWNYVRNEPTSTEFNELAKSNKTKNYAREIADQIIRLSRWYPKQPNNDKYNEEREAYFDKMIEKAFIKDVFIVGKNNELNSNSLIVNSLKDVTRNYRWGTQTDLQELARIYNLNLHTLINGNAPYEPVDTPRRPIITMNNQHNRHWTTCISFLGSSFKGKRYDSYTKDSVISKQEIKDIMQTYTQGFVASVTKRNHLEQAMQIIQLCDNSDFDVNDIVRMLSNYLQRSNFNNNSSFKKRADYIIARAEYFNEAADRKPNGHDLSV